MLSLSKANIEMFIDMSRFDRRCGFCFLCLVFSRDNLPSVTDSDSIKSFEYSSLWDSPVACLLASFVISLPISSSFLSKLSVFFGSCWRVVDLARKSFLYLFSNFPQPSSILLPTLGSSLNRSLPHVTQRESFQRYRLFLVYWQGESLLGVHFPLQVIQLQFIQ